MHGSSTPGIGRWLAARERLSGDKVALIEGDQRVTYRELNRNVNRLAHALQRQLGVRRGDRVAILSQNSIPYLELFFATAKLGAILVPLNIRLAPPEWAYQLADSGATVLCTCPALREAATPLTDPKSPAWTDTAGSRLTHFVALEHDPQATAPWVPAIAVSAGAPDNEPPSTETVTLADRHIIMYTSGTTGRPKGAVLTQANHQWNCINVAACIDLTSEDITLNALPLFHVGGIGLYTVPTLHQGGTAVIMRTFEPGAALALMGRHNVTHFFGVPAIWLFLQQHPDFAATDFSRLRTLLSGGAPLPVSLIEAYWEQKGKRIRQGMGLTETAPMLFAIDEAQAFAKRGSVGHAQLHCEAAVWDDHDHPVPPGTVGELVCRGPNLFLEYWNEPEKTTEAWRHGWFHTGDLARMDEDGYFYIVDRKKDMIISGGENVYPAEVEDVLYRLPAVAEAAVIGVPDARWGEVPLAVIALKPGADLTLAALQSFCAGHLARYKIPKHLRLVPALPRNAAGKVQKVVLREQFGSGDSAVGEAGA